MRIRSRVMKLWDHDDDEVDSNEMEHVSKIFIPRDSILRVDCASLWLGHENRQSCDKTRFAADDSTDDAGDLYCTMPSYWQHVQDLLYLRPRPAAVSATTETATTTTTTTVKEMRIWNAFLLQSDNVVHRCHPKNDMKRSCSNNCLLFSRSDPSKDLDYCGLLQQVPSEQMGSLCHSYHQDPLRMIPSDTNATLTYLSKRDQSRPSGNHASSLEDYSNSLIPSLIQPIMIHPFPDSHDAVFNTYPVLPYGTAIPAPVPSSWSKRKQRKRVGAPTVVRHWQASYETCHPHDAILAFSQQVMKELVRKWNLDTVETDLCTVISSNNNHNHNTQKNLQVYLKRKKMKWKQDKIFRKSLRIIEQSSSFSSWSHVNQQYQNKRLLFDVDLYIRTDPYHGMIPPCPTNDVKDRQDAEHPFQTSNMLDESMFQCLYDLKRQWWTSTCEITTISSRRNSKSKWKDSTPNQQDSVFVLQNHESLQLHEFMDRRFPVPYNKLNNDHDLFLKNIHHQEEDIMILPFQLGIDPVLPPRTSDTTILTNRTFDTENNHALQWHPFEVVGSMTLTRSHKSIMSQKRLETAIESGISSTVEASHSFISICHSDKRILNGMHIMGLNRIVDRCKIEYGLFLSHPVKDVIRKDQDYTLVVSNIRMPSFLEILFPIETSRKLRIIPNLSSLGEVPLNELSHWVPNVKSFLKEQNWNDACHTCNSGVMLTMNLYENMLFINTNVAIKGELMHLLSKSMEWNSSNVKSYISSPSSIGDLDIHATKDILQNSNKILPLICETDSNRKKSLKRQRKKERKERRKLDAKEDSRHEKKKRKKDKTYETSRKYLDEQVNRCSNSGSSTEVVRTANNDGTTTISVPKLHVGVTPMIMTRKTYSVQTTVTEQLMFASDSSPNNDARRNHSSAFQDRSSSQQNNHEIQSISLKSNTLTKYGPKSESRQGAHQRMTNNVLNDKVAGVTPPSGSRNPLLSTIPHSREHIFQSTNASHDHLIPQIPDSYYADFDINHTSPDVYDGMDHNANLFTDPLTNNQQEDCPNPLVLCSERFLEQASPAAADLSSGMWISSLYKNVHEESMNPQSEGNEVVNSREVGQRFTLYDCGLVDKCGVDFDLGQGRAIRIFFPGGTTTDSHGGVFDGSSECSVKDFMRHMVHVCASGRYREIHLFFVLDLDAMVVSSQQNDYHVKDLCMIQNALVRQQGSPCDNIRIHHMTHATLSFHLGRLLMSVLPSDGSSPFSMHDGFFSFLSPTPMDFDLIQRAHFLLALAPSMNAYECITLIERTKSYSLVEVLWNLTRSDQDDDLNGIKSISRSQIYLCLKSSVGRQNKDF